MNEIEEPKDGINQTKWMIFIEFMLNGKSVRKLKSQYPDFLIEEVIRECYFKLSQERKTIIAKKPK